MKVLIIGQLPKEIGGNYTTGAANVVYELSRQHIDGVESFYLGTNILNKRAKLNSTNYAHYIGYRRLALVGVVKDFLLHPLITIR